MKIFWYKFKNKKQQQKLTFFNSRWRMIVLTGSNVTSFVDTIKSPRVFIRLKRSCEQSDNLIDVLSNSLCWMFSYLNSSLNNTLLEYDLISVLNTGSVSPYSPFCFVLKSWTTTKSPLEKLLCFGGLLVFITATVNEPRWKSYLRERFRTHLTREAKTGLFEVELDGVMNWSFVSVSSRLLEGPPPLEPDDTKELLLCPG